VKLNGKTLLIAAIVLVAMTLEAVVIYMLMPPKTQQATAAPDETKETPEETEKNDDTEEVLIDSFNCTNNRIAPGSVVHLSFKVICVVSEGQKNPFIEAANTKHKTRVRQAIERIARSASLEELNDPALSVLKRLIREDVNKILNRSFVSEVVITDFRMMEQ
jgi:flagellar basal body-associated protein FliL